MDPLENLLWTVINGEGHRDFAGYPAKNCEFDFACIRFCTNVNGPNFCKLVAARSIDGSNGKIPPAPKTTNQAGIHLNFHLADWVAASSLIRTAGQN